MSIAPARLKNVNAPDAIKGPSDASSPVLCDPPPVRRKGFGSAIVADLEEEAELRSCRSLWRSTTSAAEFFDRLGYVRCDRAAVPTAISTTTEFAAHAQPEVCSSGVLAIADEVIE